jgi:pyrroline-5-carboxylate reductase
VFYLAEAMIEAGRRIGLTDDDAATLTKQTVLGAAKLMIETGVDPAELRRRVTSPGGTTEAAIEHLQAQAVAEHVIDAIAKADTRSKELGAG